MDLILKPIHSTIKINYLWVIRVILSFGSQGRATELSSALLICCLAVLWIPLHNKCIPLRCVPIWDFSYLLENRAIVSCVLYTLHSLNGNDSLSSFSRISAFPGCFRVFVLGGGGGGIWFGLGCSFVCFGGINACSSFCERGHFEERSLLGGRERDFQGIYITYFNFSW